MVIVGGGKIDFCHAINFRKKSASFLFLYFSKKIYRNIFLVLDFIVLYPYRPAGGRQGAYRPAEGR